MSARLPLSLSSPEGELLSIRVSVEPRLLEDLLECLALLPFHINPQIYHGNPTVVEFPAYAPQLETVRRELASAGFDGLVVQPMLAAITAA